MKCVVCGGSYRGKGTRVFVAASAPGLGGIRRVIACPACSGKCLRISLDAAATRCACGGIATTCTACEAARAPKIRSAVVGGAIKRIVGLMRAYPKGNPMHAGLSMAFDVLTSGQWEDLDIETGKGG